jgi:hypothetical protein
MTSWSAYGSINNNKKFSLNQNIKTRKIFFSFLFIILLLIKTIKNSYLA